MTKLKNKKQKISDFDLLKINNYVSFIVAEI